MTLEALNAYGTTYLWPTWIGHCWVIASTLLYFVSPIRSGHVVLNVPRSVSTYVSEAYSATTRQHATCDDETTRRRFTCALAVMGVEPCPVSIMVVSLHVELEVNVGCNVLMRLINIYN